MAFGSPYTDKYPKFIENTLKKSRKGKDALAPLYKFFKSTRIYDHVLKYTPRYFTFSVFGGIFCTFFIGSAVDSYWKKKLYIDMPPYEPPEPEE